MSTLPHRVIKTTKFNEISRVKCTAIVPECYLSPVFLPRRAKGQLESSLACLAQQVRCTWVLSSQCPSEAVCEFRWFSPSAYCLVQAIFHGLTVISDHALSNSFWIGELFKALKYSGLSLALQGCRRKWREFESAAGLVMESSYSLTVGNFWRTRLIRHWGRINGRGNDFV